MTPITHETVKALEWKENAFLIDYDDCIHIEACTAADTSYTIDGIDDEGAVLYILEYSNCDIGDYKSLEEAKAAAQSDYDRRIRSALISVEAEAAKSPVNPLEPGGAMWFGPDRTGDEIGLERGDISPDLFLCLRGKGYFRMAHINRERTALLLSQLSAEPESKPVEVKGEIDPVAWITLEEMESLRHDGEAGIDSERLHHTDIALYTHPQSPPAPDADALREALQGLEDACETLAQVRTQALYDAMIKEGHADALIDLDKARRAARTALTASKPATEVK